MRCLLTFALILLWPAFSAAEVSVNDKNFDPGCGVQLRHDADRLSAAWSLGKDVAAELVLDLRPDQPLIQSLSVRAATGDMRPVLQHADPLILLTVGERDLAKQDGWVAFFDNPPLRPQLP